MEHIYLLNHCGTESGTYREIQALGVRVQEISSGGWSNGRTEKEQSEEGRINGVVSGSSWRHQLMDRTMATFQLDQLEIFHYPMRAGSCYWHAGVRSHANNFTMVALLRCGQFYTPQYWFRRLEFQYGGTNVFLPLHRSRKEPTPSPRSHTKCLQKDS